MKRRLLWQSFVALLVLSFASAVQATPPMTWGPEINASTNTPGTDENWPRIAAVGDTVHVTWWSSGASGAAYYKRSLDGGATWQDQRVLSTAMSYVYDVVVHGNKVIVFWRES